MIKLINSTTKENIKIKNWRIALNWVKQEKKLFIITIIYIYIIINNIIIIIDILNITH